MEGPERNLRARQERTEEQLRSGDYRIRFSVEQGVILILRVLHRSRAYR